MIRVCFALVFPKLGRHWIPSLLISFLHLFPDSVAHIFGGGFYIITAYYTILYLYFLNGCFLHSGWWLHKPTLWKLKIKCDWILVRLNLFLAYTCCPSNPRQYANTRKIPPSIWFKMKGKYFEGNRLLNYRKMGELYSISQSCPL